MIILKYGLKLPSVIRVHKLASLEKEMIEVKLGEINNSVRTEVIGIIQQLLQ